MSDKAENDASKFDWVTARSQCSLPNVFQALRLQVEDDVKTRNALRPENAPYEFSVAENGGEFTVNLDAKDVHLSVVFTLAERSIIVRDDQIKTRFEITLTFSDGGECKLNVNEKTYQLWQVRRMALEGLMFRTN